jgi:outer membrane biogenesis lipoprotein LolB
MTIKWHKTYSPAVLVLTALLLTACSQSAPRKLTIVSGKTVYGIMAMEDADIAVYRWEPSRWRYISDTRSGYHGSFRVHLPPGTYSIKASKTIRVGQGEVSLTGKLEGLKVEERGGRIDQIVVIMVPVSGL